MGGYKGKEERPTQRFPQQQVQVASKKEARSSNLSGTEKGGQTWLRNAISLPCATSEPTLQGAKYPAVSRPPEGLSKVRGWRLCCFLSTAINSFLVWGFDFQGLQTQWPPIS